jgi:hypothetical protein
MESLGREEGEGKMAGRIVGKFLALWFDNAKYLLK